MSFLRTSSDCLNSLYTKALMLGGKIMYRKQYDNLLNLHPDCQSLEHEADYIAKWKPLQRRPHKQSYRLFSQYMADATNIVPEDICSGIIQPLLNPIEYRPYYQDKNMFDLIIGRQHLPNTLLRCIRGGYYDAEYQHITNLENKTESLLSSDGTLFLKPAIDSSSGVGVIALFPTANGLATSDGEPFNIDFINRYKSRHPDFIIQEGLSQHSSLARFNPTSINTIRIATYKSVKNDEVKICGAILRIGKSGENVDNAHAGGRFIGIGPDGNLNNYICDQYGNRYNDFNGIDFSKSNYKIHDFQHVLEFAKMIGEKVFHHRLLALDIAVTEDGTPKLIEFNVRAFSTWLFQFSGQPALGDNVTEIVDYCKDKLSTISKVHVEPF